MGDEGAYQAWRENPGFKMAKLFPADWESAIAELYFGDLIWAYVALQGVDQAATGPARVRDARAVVEFWREPDKPRGVWDFNLDLAGALEQIKQAEEWLFDNETGRQPSTDDGLTAAGRAVGRMSEEEQAIPLNNDEIEVTCDLLALVKRESTLSAVAGALWKRLQPIRHGDYGGTASTTLSPAEARAVIDAGDFTQSRIPLDDDETALVARLRSLVG